MQEIPPSLASYIESEYSQGTTSKELKTQLARAGWEPAVVELALDTIPKPKSSSALQTILCILVMCLAGASAYAEYIYTKNQSVVVPVKVVSSVK